MPAPPEGRRRRLGLYVVLEAAHEDSPPGVTATERAALIGPAGVLALQDGLPVTASCTSKVTVVPGAFPGPSRHSQPMVASGDNTDLACPSSGPSPPPMAQPLPRTPGPKAVYTSR